MANVKSASNHGKVAGKSGLPLSKAGTISVVLQATPTRKRAGTVAVAVEPATLKALSAKPANIKALMEVFGRSIEQSLESGRSSGFKVEVDPRGNSKISPLSEDEDEAPRAATDDVRLEQALAAARARGRVRAAEVLGGDEMLSAEAFANRLGISRVTVNTRRQRHEFLALDGAKRGFRFPEWQVDENGKPLKVLPKLFEVLGDSPWTVYRFLVQRHSVLGGVTARDALRRGRVDDVLGAAEGIAQGDFA